MQLVAYGAQDIYLTGQPQITFFKSVYRRHTNFAMESIEQTINGQIGSGKRVTVTLARNGDLVTDVHLDFDPTTITLTPLTARSGLYAYFHMLANAELEIGGQLIDRIYPDWMKIWSSLTMGKSANTTTAAVLESDTLEATMLGLGAGLSSAASRGRAQLPLLFYFWHNPGLAIPLIALQYHEVKIVLELAGSRTAVIATDGTTGSVDMFAKFVDSNDLKVYADYVYLDTTERRKFAQNAHEYLITQHQQVSQTVDPTLDNLEINLNFNHPVKYLTWQVANLSYYSYGGGNSSINGAFYDASTPYDTAKVVLNGTDRFAEQKQTYFNSHQVYRHWPTSDWWHMTSALQAVDFTTGNIPTAPAVYSFALRPAEHQPSGTCNFSRIDNAQLFLTGVQTDTVENAPVGYELRVNAENYNVLRIMSGMGGLAYSN